MPLPWFRRKQATQERPSEPAPPAPATPVVAVPQAPPAETGEHTTAAAAAKRRRGSRGGRGRKKPGAETTGATETAPAAEKKTPERKSERRSTSQSSSRSTTRRRQAPKRAPLPAAKRELLVSVDVGEQRVAVLEDDRVAEVYLERPERRSIAGNIYLGTVDNVLPGMEAAFVEIGLGKNGFLYVDEIVVPELEGKRHGKKIQDLIARGQELLVQAVKDPMKTKGARLTTEISLPGRFVVFVPQGEGLGVSRRLPDDERTRLKEIIKGLDVSKGGVIVRTAAEGASAEDIERDLVFLQRLWKTIQARAKTAKSPELVYQEAELPLRVVRDLFTGDFERALVDDDRAYKRIVGYLKKTSPHMVERVIRYKEKTPLMEAFGVERRDPLHAEPPRRPPLGRLPDLRLRRGVHRRRREHGPLRRLALEELRSEARGHDHEEQPRGREGGRAPAPPARHRRDHRDRFHRHGEPEEPRHGRAGARRRARAGPDEDLRRRDLPARPRRDDPPERHRRAARDPHEEVPDLRRRRDRPLRDVGRGRRRAAPARARRRLAHAVLQGRAEREGRERPDRPRRARAWPRSRRRRSGASSSPPRRTPTSTTSWSSRRARSPSCQPHPPLEEGARGRAEARRDRPSRPERGGRQGRRLRGLCRRRREARRQEGARFGSRAPSSRRPTRPGSMRRRCRPTRSRPRARPRSRPALRAPARPRRAR